MEQQQQQQQMATQTAATSQVVEPSAADQQKSKMQEAQATYDMLSQKKNRTPDDEAKFKSAAQILARNK